MKKIITLLLTVLMVISLAGCGKKGGGDNPKPTPAPAPQPVEQKTVSRIGTDEDVEALLEAFNTKYRSWSAFYIDQEPEMGIMYYELWDDSDVYRGNYTKYLDHGLTPVSELMVRYEDGEKTGPITHAYIFLPFEDITKVTEEQEEPLAEWGRMAVKALLPDLTEKQLSVLLDKIAVPDAEGFEAFATGYSDPSELETTREDIYLTEDGEAAYTIGCTWDEEYQAILVEFEPKK